MWNRKLRFFLFGLYEYFSSLEHKFYDLLPQVVRNFVWRLRLGSFGQGSMVAYGTYFRYPKKTFIGNNVSINRNCSFYNSHHIKDTKIVIKDNVTIGPEVTFFVAGHDHSKIQLPDTASSITIENFVWIGGRSTICPGVTIREGAVIGAGAVVTKEIDSYVIVGGNPAKVIKKRVVE